MASLGSCQGCSPAEDLQTSQGESSNVAHRTRQKRGSCVWYMATWNVRTLLDMEGPVGTARHSCDMSVVDERKIDQVISELDRYKVSVAVLQETKWFGNEIYRK